MLDHMEKTSKPTVAGILNIITGVIALLWFIRLIILIVIMVITMSGGDLGILELEAIPYFLQDVSWVIPSLIFGMLALVT